MNATAVASPRPLARWAAGLLAAGGLGQEHCGAGSPSRRRRTRAAAVRSWEPPGAPTLELSPT